MIEKTMQPQEQTMRPQEQTGQPPQQPMNIAGQAQGTPGAYQAGTCLMAHGWSDRLEAARAACGRPDWVPARVMSEQRHLYHLLTEAGTCQAEVSGRFRASAAGTGDFPCVGDWVMAQVRPGEDAATIHAVLPRQTRFSRRAAGPRADEQVMAANFDAVLLAMSLNDDYNLRRLERYLVMAWDSGAMPVVVLTKLDLARDAEALIRDVEQLAAGVPVLAVSAVTGEGMSGLDPWAVPGKTLVVLGSSGVGKSTLMNRLAGKELARTQAIREDDARGRHTTTHRELYRLDSGVLVLDTPGIRELQLWESDTGMEDAFPDIQALADTCRFRDCTHDREPGCAVREAVACGSLPATRYDSWRKLGREMAFISQKSSHASREAERKFGRMVTRMQRSNPKNH